MADAAKRKGKRKPMAEGEEAEKLTPEEEAVAKALLWELPGREGMLMEMRMKVRIFFAEEAVEYLMKSRFATKPAKGSSTPLLKDTKAAVDILGALMAKGLFHRALKLQKEKRPKKEAAAKAKKKQDGSGEEDDDAQRREKKLKEKEEKRKRGRPRLEMHEAQAFVNAPGEVYIWQYDPTRPRNLALGFLLVLGSICLCLFPMWPSELKTGTYYLSVGLLCLLGALFGIAVLRYPLFGLVWAASFGSVHFWFLPNLTEDVGVLESFMPVFSVAHTSESASSKKSN